MFPDSDCLKKRDIPYEGNYGETVQQEERKTTPDHAGNHDSAHGLE